MVLHSFTTCCGLLVNIIPLRWVRISQIRFHIHGKTKNIKQKGNGRREKKLASYWTLAGLVCHILLSESQPYKGTLLSSVLRNQFQQSLHWHRFQFWETITRNQEIVSSSLNNCTRAKARWRQRKGSKDIIPWGLKLNSGGRKRPFGRRVFESRSSSKNEWPNASNCMHRIHNILQFQENEIVNCQS